MSDPILASFQCISQGPSYHTQTQLRSRFVCDNLDLRDAYPDTQTQLRSRFVCDNLDPERCIEKKLIWDQTSVTNRVSIKTKLMWKQKEKQIL